MTDIPEYYDGIFKDLTPDHFVLETSAVGQHWTPGADHNAGKDRFDTFIKSMIDTIRLSYAYVNGQPMDPIAVIASLDAQWVFAPDHDEDMGAYVRRLTREACELQGRWVFISRRTAVAPGWHADDVTNEAALAEAGLAGGMVEAFYWYAMRVEDGEVERRQGYMEIDDDDVRTLGPLQEMNPEQTNPVFDAILRPSA